MILYVQVGTVRIYQVHLPQVAGVGQEFFTNFFFFFFFLNRLVSTEEQKKEGACSGRRLGAEPRAPTFVTTVRRHVLCEVSKSCVSPFAERQCTCSVGEVSWTPPSFSG